YPSGVGPTGRAGLLAPILPAGPPPVAKKYALIPDPALPPEKAPGARGACRYSPYPELQAAQNACPCCPGRPGMAFFCQFARFSVEKRNKRALGVRIVD